MKNISLQGYQSNYITMRCEKGAAAGDLVAMSQNNTVKKATEGKFMGIVHSVRGEYALIQTGGFAVVHYSGEAPKVGYESFLADSNADAVKGSGGREVLVTEVDSATKNIGILF